jgi:polar amino acid transport system permease protein
MMSTTSQESAGAAAVGGIPPTAAARPKAIKAIPVRHWVRWIFAAIVVFLVVALIHSLVKNPNVQWSVVRQYLFAPLTMHGLVLTIELTIIAMVIGVVGAVVLAVMRLSDNFVLSSIAWVYIWFFRGTPVYVQILIWGNLGALYPKLFLGVPFTGLRLGSPQTSQVIGTLMAAIVALATNEAAYAAELVRAGIISVDRGQTDAASSLGMSPTLAMRRIVLPQAMRVIIPTFGNETISMLKTTSLIAVIGGLELLGRLQLVYSQSFQIIPLLFVACFWYVSLTTVLTIGQHYLEAHFDRGFGNKETELAEKRAHRRAAKAVAGATTCDVSTDHV